jgi:uncharacterized damage-inducible protein DinB
MSVAQQMFAEFEGQAPVTRKFLERLPDDRLTWKPHQKSMSAGQLALHIAMVPAGVLRLVQQNPAQVPSIGNFPQPASVKEILNVFEETIATVGKLLPAWSDASMQETWRLSQGDSEVLAMPRAQFVRDVMLNHWYQHRGQFSVYLRLLDVAVPSSWGPSADELPAFLQKSQSA